MNLMKLSELKGHDVYEFSYAHNYKPCPLGHWNKESIYVSDEDFAILCEYIDSVIVNFNYYGPNKVYLKQWNQIRDKFICSKIENKKLLNFFSGINSWINLDINKSDYFWILGL